MKLLLLTLGIIFSSHSISQICNNPGQNPATAFPVCGTSTFAQASVPICGGVKVFSPGCTDDIYYDKNPYYYKFTCFQSGTLHFVINPNTNSDDYDWSLYDVTGVNPMDIYTNPALTIASNWSGNGGNTGMSNSGNNQFVCGGFGKPVWTKPSNLIAGHNYLLMISHFTDSQSGYALSFGGGTAVITDPAAPNMISAKPDCDGKTIKVKLSKKMLCNSIATNGSDFFITPNVSNVITASGFNCSGNFDTDEVTITLNNPLPAGNFVLRLKNGTDNNTIKDYCDKQIPLTDSAKFSFTPAIPTPIDSIAPLACAPNEIQLIFANKQIKCNSIATDGSDFLITGTYPVSIVSAAGGTCSNGITDKITIRFGNTLWKKGTFTITLKPGTDGNTIIDECNQVSITGSAKNFTTKDTVNADYSYMIKWGCVTDTIIAFHPIANEVNQWQWFTNGVISSQNTNQPQFLFNQFGIKKIMLVVNNGFCTDTVTQSIDLDNYIKADFNAFDDNCPKEPVQFTSTAIGKNLTYFWRFGDGGISADTSTSHIYFDFGMDKTYSVEHTITNHLGCTSSITKPVNVLMVCGEFVPTAFTPNGDGTNDSFGPLYAVKASNLVFRVFSRWGQKVFETNNWRQGWDGKIKGVHAPAGAYVWSLQYVNRDDGKAYATKGTVVLIR